MSQRRTIIVGAGPTGASLAYLLVRKGIPVTLVEREPTFDRLFRGEGMMPSGIDALAQMGLRKDVERLPQRRLDAWEYYMHGSFLLRVPEPTPDNRNAVRTLSQPHLLDMLVAKASEHSGFRFIPGFQVRELLWENGRVVGVLGDAPDGQRKLQGDFVIGTDGRGSIVRTRAEIDIDRRHEKSPRNYDAIWCSLPLPSWLQEETILFACAAWDSMVTFGPSPTGELRLGWLIPKGSSRRFRQLDMVEEVAKRTPAHISAHLRATKHAATRPVFFNVLFGRCHIWHKPGVLLLGDAAHPMNPTRAQGINLGLRDAIVAANHLIPALKNGASQIDLSAASARIQVERLPEIEIAQALQLKSSAPPRLFKQAWFRKAAIPLLRRLGLLQKMMLQSEQELRHGVVPVELAAYAS